MRSRRKEEKVTSWEETRGTKKGETEKEMKV